MASPTESWFLVDESLQPLGGRNGDGFFAADLTAGALYALIFPERTTDGLFLIRSTAGPITLTGSVPTNFLRSTDVNGDCNTTAMDALLIIHELNQLSSLGEGEQVASPVIQSGFFDVNGDGRISATDA